MEWLASGWELAKGFAGPLAGAGAAFAGAGLAWFKVPFLGRQLAAVLVLAGVYLLGHAQGYAGAREDGRAAELRAREKALQESIEGLQSTLRTLAGLQETMTLHAAETAAEASRQREEADGLLAKLMAGPVAVGCSWSGPELNGVRSIRVAPPAGGSHPPAR